MAEGIAYAEEAPGMGGRFPSQWTGLNVAVTTGTAGWECRALNDHLFLAIDLVAHGWCLPSP